MDKHSAFRAPAFLVQELNPSFQGPALEIIAIPNSMLLLCNVFLIFSGV